jgi:beta-lactamase class D
MLKILSLFILVSCATSRNFPAKNVCYLLYNLKSKKFEKEINPKFCKVQLPAASTFKVPLAVMGFDSGILKDETTLFKWDGQKRFLEVWNKDHNARSWMKESVVWYSQVLTSKLGMDKTQNYLNKFHYGNQDLSSGLKYSWLTPSPTESGGVKNSLKISAYEQVSFLEKLWNEALPVSQLSQAKTKSILAKDENPPHRELLGKTGSGFIDDEMKLRLGWYVAHLKVGMKEYIVVTNFTDAKEMPQPRNFGGPEAKELTKQLLIEDDLF